VAKPNNALQTVWYQGQYSFLTPTAVGGWHPCRLKFALKATHFPLKNRRLRQISAYNVSTVRDNEKSSAICTKFTEARPIVSLWRTKTSPGETSFWQHNYDLWEQQSPQRTAYYRFLLNSGSKSSTKLRSSYRADRWYNRLAAVCTLSSIYRRQCCAWRHLYIESIFHFIFSRVSLEAAIARGILSVRRTIEPRLIRDSRYRSRPMFHTAW